MAVNISDLPDQTLSNRIESLPPKLRTIKSHPYLDAYSTPPLPKPMHFHQLSDQTGQSSHHHHQLSTISLPSQHSQVKNTNPFVDYPPAIQPTFKPAFGNQPTAGFNQQPGTFNPQPNQTIPAIPAVPAIPSVFNQPQYAQIEKPQPIYLNGNLNGNIEQYETTFSYNDLDKNNDPNKQQIYINHPVISRPTDRSKLITSDPARSLNKTDQVNGQSNGQVNGYHFGQITCKPNSISQLNQIESNLNAQKIYSNHSHFAENSNQSTYHGLPIKFVKALKKLFDIFDTNKCGLVRIVDIESRINDEEFDEELDRPQDLIDSLRKVTSPNGLINFSNFCAAINICLLKNQLAKSKQQENYKSSSVKSRNSDRNDSYLRAQNLDHKTNGYPGYGHQLNGHRFPKQSSINSNSPLENSSFTSTNSSSSNSSARLHKDPAKNSPPHNSQANSQHSSRSNQCNGSQKLNSKLKLRPSSVPVESFNDDETDYYKNCSDQPCTISKKLDGKAKSMGNLKEQIYANKLRLCSSESRLQQHTVSPSQIMEKLFEWRNNLLERKLRSMNLTANGNRPSFSQPPAAVPVPPLGHLYSIVNKKTVNNRKRDEMRRHTVNIVQSNLQSMNTTNKLTNMNREKELLQKGLLIIDRAKQFYLRHVAIVQNQIDALSQYASGNNFFLNQLNSDYNIRQHLDKLNDLEQINRSLALLIDDQLPQNNRLNVVQTEIELQKQNLTIIKLKEKIQMLSDELVRKTNLISSLEKANPSFSVC